MAIPPKIAAEYSRIGKEAKGERPKIEWGAIWTLVFVLFGIFSCVGLFINAEFVFKWVFAGFIGGLFTLAVCLVYVMIVGVTLYFVMKDGLWYLGLIPLLLNPLMLAFFNLMMNGAQGAGFFVEFTRSQISETLFAWVFGVAQVVALVAVGICVFQTNQEVLKPLPRKIRKAVVKEELLRKTLLALITFAIYIALTVYYLGLPAEVRLTIALLILGILVVLFLIFLFLSNGS